ncbi:hypothetical protein [Geodermatophilus sp. URMC 62]|uniref:hypothetical protein n=1 Tax=Geodermatophilus sp. URMC 62 TaxID=3423414 RepID=UPI00406C8A8A
MERRGVNHDVGTATRGAGWTTRLDFDPAVVRRELEVIAEDLHCTAVRISGQDVGRLTTAARLAREVGLEVWLSPVLVDADQAATLAHLRTCAAAAEEVRAEHGGVVLVTGCELTLFTSGLVDGATSSERMRTFARPWRLVRSTLRRGSFTRRLDDLLRDAVATVRADFAGPVSYASGAWEQVDWTPFDLAGIDHYHDARSRGSYRRTLRRLAASGKPVVVLEFGCCTYAGAEDRGSHGWTIVDRSTSPPRLRDGHRRDEAAQAAHLEQVLGILEEEGVDGAFGFTLAMPSYPGDPDPALDLDTASYALVRTLPAGSGAGHCGLPWEPKASFAALARRYGSARPTP